MTDIKIQGKREDNKEWVKGYLLELQSGQYAIYTNPKYGSTLTVWQFIKLHTHAVIPETIGRFTGLKDKHDVEIYEGHVLKWNPTGAEYVIGVVEFIEGGFCANKWVLDSALSWGKFDGEVIGHSFDNPNILNEV